MRENSALSTLAVATMLSTPSVTVTTNVRCTAANCPTTAQISKFWRTVCPSMLTRRSRRDLNGGEVRVVDTCRCHNVEHSVCDRDNERSLHRGKLSDYRPDIKILENSLPFYANQKITARLEWRRSPRCRHLPLPQC